MSISAAIIMKNEERIIGRCLAAVALFADEIIVVDSGSTDQSKELAAKFPKVRVFDSELFNKDTPLGDFEFSRAKNEAIRRCTGDWVVWFDADDVIDTANAAKIKQIAADEKGVFLYSFKVISGSLSFEHCRMFANGKGILFDENHACHEFLDSRNHPVALRYDVEIQHLPEHTASSAHKRNLAILEKDYYVRKHEDQRTLFYLAGAYRDSGQLLRAVEFYDKYLAVSQWREERFFARFYKAQCLFASGLGLDSKDEALRALGEDGRFAEALCLVGDAEMVGGNMERAILWYKLAMATPIPKDARLFVTQAAYSQYPAHRIGECMAKLGPGKEEEKTVSPPKQEIFALPSDRGLAMLAAAALSNVATSGKVPVGVVTRDEWQRDMVIRFTALKVAEGEGKKLSLPLNLKGIHAQEWYARSAGHIGISQQPVWATKRDESRRLHVVITPGVTLPAEVIEKIRQAGKDMKPLDPACKFQEAEVAFANAAAYIGEAGWLQHLARWWKVPAFVLLDGRSPREFGWDDQENRSLGDLPEMFKFLERSLT